MIINSMLFQILDSAFCLLIIKANEKRRRSLIYPRYKISNSALIKIFRVSFFNNYLGQKDGARLFGATDEVTPLPWTLAPPI